MKLQRTVTGISARVLSNELKQLEQNSFIKRIHTGGPVVEYEQTDYSDTMDKVLGSLREWGLMHRARTKKEVIAKSK